MKRLLPALLCCLAAASCAPVVGTGAPLALPADLVDSARVTTVIMSSDWLDAESDFAETFSEEVAEELGMCASGDYPLQLRVHVSAMERADRLGPFPGVPNRHSIRATAELVDPARNGLVVGRYPVQVETPASSGPLVLVADRQMMVSEAFGRALCHAAFDHNPRRVGPHNATRD